ncbi:DUF2147 domain-containing protein [Conchiformibius steedae]|uniref:DUF2147 domain-containing protein n=1 Tax=Conchiformibius steedae TaxID=153493 RepID=A0A3P2A3Y9_9NEIS|nr:DUF2147 domain-containing protein [Conchiformibius steedae]RRD90172.1 DUF2147 domain-containing protein [Conchiformibius steedae]
MKSVRSLLLGAFLLSGLAHAAGIEGKWRTTDDKTGKPKAVVQISKGASGYQGKIISLEQGVENLCPACKDKRPLVGLTVLTGLQEKGKEYTDGKIFDPKGGKTYQAKAELSADGKTLKVRGFLGISALGRTQTWKHVD